MDPRLKRILLIAGFAAAVVLMGVLIFTILFRPPTVAPTPDEEEPLPPGSLPGAEPGVPTVVPGEPDEEEPGILEPSPIATGGPTFTQQLTTSGVSSPNVSGNTVAYYDPNDGRFYTIDSEGNVVALSDAQFPQAETVVISNNAQSAAIEFPDGSNVLYNFTTETQTTLPNHWEDFDFSPAADQVVTKSIGIDPNNRSLVVTSADGTRTQVIAALGTNDDDVQVNWSPNNQIVGFSETGSVQTGFGRRQIYLISQDGEEAGGLIVEGGNFSALWSPTGSHILYSVADFANDNRPSLWYTNATGQVGSERTKFPLETWVEKCTFSDANTVYCAVPRAVVNESGLDQNLITSADDVYAIDLRSGRTSLLASPVLNLSMFNLFVSEDGSTLYFTDNLGRLNSMRLE